MQKGYIVGEIVYEVRYLFWLTNRNASLKRLNNKNEKKEEEISIISARFVEIENISLTSTVKIAALMNLDYFKRFFLA